jgi:hypothetical protein
MGPFSLDTRGGGLGHCAAKLRRGPRPATRAIPMESNLSPGGAPLRVVMNGDRLDIQASVDLAGLKKLKEMLTKFEGILEMLGPNDSK